MYIIVNKPIFDLYFVSNNELIKLELNNKYFRLVIKFYEISPQETKPINCIKVFILHNLHCKPLNSSYITSKQNTCMTTAPTMDLILNPHLSRVYHKFSHYRFKE